MFKPRTLSSTMSIIDNLHVKTAIFTANASSQAKGTKSLLNARDDISNGARGLNLGLRLNLHLCCV